MIDSVSFHKYICCFVRRERQNKVLNVTFVEEVGETYVTHAPLKNTALEKSAMDSTKGREEGERGGGGREM